MELNNTAPIGSAPSGQAPETGQPSTPPAESPQLSPQQQTREDIYAKYYGAQQTQPPASEHSAQEEPEGGGKEDAGAPPDDPYAQRIALLENQLAMTLGVLEQLATAQQSRQQVPPQQPARNLSEWVDLLREGKIDDATKKLAEIVAEQLEPKVLPRAKDEATTEALELFRVEQALTQFVDTVRKENPDLLPMEEFIAAKAQAKLEQRQRAGLVQNASQYIEAYKTSVNEAVAEARKLLQSVRATGKEAATVRTREVLSSSPVRPSSIAADHGSPPPAEEPPREESPLDYIARRRAQMARTAGLVQ